MFLDAQETARMKQVAGGVAKFSRTDAVASTTDVSAGMYTWLSLNLFVIRHVCAVNMWRQSEPELLFMHVVQAFKHYP